MKKLILLVIIVIVGFVLYSRFLAINEFTINQYTISSENIPSSFNDLKIVHFSDVLFNEYNSIKKFEELIVDINKLKPDIVFFTGDLIDNTYKLSDNEQEKIIEGLKNIEVSLHKFAIAGDNDLKNIDSYKTILDDSNFIFLDNESYTLFYDSNDPIVITGITDINADDIYKIDENITSNYNITLIHEPDLIDKVKGTVNVFVSGHSLGGSVRLPFFGPIINKENAKKYTDMHYPSSSDYAHIFVSNGLGVEKYPFRLFNTPSINLYKLNHKEKTDE